MEDINERLLNDPEYQNFMMLKPSLAEESVNAYTTPLIHFMRFTNEPLYKTVHELRSMQNDRIENNVIIRFNPNQSKINMLQYEYIDFLRSVGCRDSTINYYIRVLRIFLNTLGIILPKAPKLNAERNGWYLLSKEDLKYVLDVSNVYYKALINFAAVTGLRVNDIASLSVRDFMVATEEYHDCTEVEDFLNSAPKGMIGFWELVPHKTRRLNIECKVCNTPESSDAILLALNERVKYFEKKNRKDGLDLKLTKNDALFPNRNSKYKTFSKPQNLTCGLYRYKHKLNAERERVLKHRYEHGEISKETYEESISIIPNFHAHALRKFFISTLAKNRVDARISALMEGHKPPIATDGHYVDNDFLKEAVKEEYMRCIPDLSFENVEVRFLTSEERKSLEEQIAELTEENRSIKQNMESYVDKAVEERFNDAFDMWLNEKGG